MVIESRDNPKIKLLGKLLSSKKARAEQGLFVIEGVRGCADALRSRQLGEGLEISSVFYSPELLDDDRFSALRELIGAFDMNSKYEISASLAERISDAQTSQGVFAVCKRLDKRLCAEALKPEGKYLVLESLQDPGNLGTVIRTADAVGVGGVILTGSCVELYNPKVVRSAVGSLPRVELFVENDRALVFGLFKAKGIRTAAAVISGGENIIDHDFSGGCAAVIGNEGNGLSEEAVSACDDKVTIFMHGNIDSLNAATAAAIFLWEMKRGEG